MGGVSGIVQFRYWLAHPDKAPSDLQAQLRAASGLLTPLGGRAATALPKAGVAPFGNVFNHDRSGLPQDEESSSVCHSNPNVVIQGTNDFRGLVDPQGDFTGWYLSTDGGHSVANEGLLPPVTIDGQKVPSGGDPVDVAAPRCTLYASDLNYGLSGATGQAVSGVGVYRSTQKTLSTCPSAGTSGTLTNPSCWPTRRNIATAPAGHFFDKEWMDVGPSGSAGEVVWIAWGDLSRFDSTGTEHAGVIRAVRCDPSLAHCTNPITISTGQKIAEYPDVTIGPDGRVYVTWSQFVGRSFTAPVERGWFAVAQPGSTHFSAPRLVVPQFNRILRGHPLGSLHANDFRLIGTLFQNTVKMVSGHPRVFDAWAECRSEILGLTVCEEPQIHLTYSDDFGKTWSKPSIISEGGDNYFVSLDTDPTTGVIVAAYYTNRYDPIFHNRQDVEVVTLTDNGRVLQRLRATQVSDETEADPLLRGAFIGDYIEVSADHGIAYVGYNANERSEKLLGTGVPVPQQDNYLTPLHERV